MHIFTICAKNYFSLALALGQSIKLHHKEARFTIFVADGVDGLSLNYQQSSHQIIDARVTLPAEIFEDMAFKYDVTEFCTSFKPAAFKYLFLTEENSDLFCYLDPDTYLYSRLDPITDIDPYKTLYLVPHILECKVIDENPIPEYRHLFEGIFNLGFCAIRRTDAAKLILDWWDHRLRNYAYADYSDGLHTDQKWMDYAIVFFADDLHVVRHYGANVAHWNLVERPITIRDGVYYAGSCPLIFFHFSGFDFKSDKLTKHSSEQDQIKVLTVETSILAKEYREQVIGNGFINYIALPYVYSNFSNGALITKLHRRVYRELSSTHEYRQPFDINGLLYEEFRRAGLID
jgi:hypothetical protein